MIQAALHLATAALVAVLLGGTTPAVLIAALVLGLAPDIDNPRALIGRLLLPISSRIEATVGHRTATHSIFALLLVGGLAYAAVPAYWLALAGAYASHLLIDLVIGSTGVMVFWPATDEFTLAGFRDDGPAPRVLLLCMLPALIIAALWPQLGLIFDQPLRSAYAAANPIATPSPAPTAKPSIHLSFELPAGVGLSALTVHKGDTIREGQVLAHWPIAAPTPWPTPTTPPTAEPPGAAVRPLADAAPQSRLAEAQAALDALHTSQHAARSALLAAHQRDLAAAQRALAERQRALGELQPQHERAQAEAQHAVDAAGVEVADVRAAQGLADQGQPVEVQRATERVHAAEAQLTAAVDAQARMRTDQGIERAAAVAAVAAAQVALGGLPTEQRQALATLAEDQQAACTLASARVESARMGVQQAEQQAEQAAAAVQATASAEAKHWAGDAKATAQAHRAAVQATVQAVPTAQPAQVVSRAAGTVITVGAEESGGVLVVTLEVVR